MRGVLNNPVGCLLSWIASLDVGAGHGRQLWHPGSRATIVVVLASAHEIV